jgi:hypothetical protein
MRAAQAAGIGGARLYHAQQQQSAEPLAAEIRDRSGVAVARPADLAAPANIPALFDWCDSNSKCGEAS